MKKCTTIILELALTAALFGCGAQPEPTTVPTTIPETTVPETTVPETIVPETTVPETTAPCTVQYLEDCPPELLMEYWDEMVHEIEYTDGTGDTALVQKWLYPITCRIYGEPTLEDVEILEAAMAADRFVAACCVRMLSSSLYRAPSTPVCFSPCRKLSASSYRP